MNIARTLPSLQGDDALETDIDLRIVEIWHELPPDNEGLTLEVVASLMRACYGKGYIDALAEDTPGALCLEHGFRVPARRPVLISDTLDAHQAVQLLEP